jgi:hypothetical protein
LLRRCEPTTIGWWKSHSTRTALESYHTQEELKRPADNRHPSTSRPAVDSHGVEFNRWRSHDNEKSASHGAGCHRVTVTFGARLSRPVTTLPGQDDREKIPEVLVVVGERAGRYVVLEMERCSGKPPHRTTERSVTTAATVGAGRSGCLAESCLEARPDHANPFLA